MATGFPVNSTAPSKWSTSLLDCFYDFPSCLITCCCPCVTFGQIAEIVDKGSTSCGTSGAVYGALSVVCCGWLYSCCYRSKLRQQYMLAESPCGDCLVHCCCNLCALCQEHRELRLRGFDMSLGWEGNMEWKNRGVAMNPAMNPEVYVGMNR